MERTQSSVYGNILNNDAVGEPSNLDGAGGGSHNIGGMMGSGLVKEGLGKDGKGDNTPAWMTKRGLEEISLQQEKLVDQGFHSRESTFYPLGAGRFSRLTGV